MALSLQDIVLAKRRFFHAVALSPATRMQTMALFSFLAQSKGSPQLQVVEFPALSSTDVVIANAACKLYAVVLHKATATATFFKATDHATTCSTDGTQDISLRLAAIQHTVLITASGKAFTNGITCQGSTTGTGATGSAANGADGVFLIGSAT